MTDPAGTPPAAASVVDQESRQSVRPTGRFRVYLGSAAGVGKTVAMLDEGWRRLQRGADVVIGFVETHGRPHTAEQIRDLEIVPRESVDYRGAVFEEMDLAAVLARRPELVLVDELAHTNVPGSGPHDKRWQDVLDLLAAGIAVITTVNIQHLESLADAVEAITGVAIKERVPDHIVRQADQIELIDSSADQLRRRMLHGNIYPTDKVPQALNGFFQTQNLVALRELALRFVADETEDELLGYLRDRHPGAPWDTAERILVAVTGAPGNDAVVRRAARIVARTKGDLMALHVNRADGDRAGGGQPGGAATGERSTSGAGGRAGGSLDMVRQLVDDVGGTWHERTADDPARAVVDFAADHQVTQIVVGATRRTRFEELTRGSAVRKVLRLAAESGIDVHVIARREPTGDLREDAVR